MPTRVGDAAAAIERARNAYRETHGREPTRAELSEATGMTELQVAAAERITPDPLSLSLAQDEDRELLDTVADPESERGFVEAELDDDRAHLLVALATLHERERSVLMLRFGLDGDEPKTLEELGEHFNVTRERIRQIEAKAMTKLRHPATPSNLAPTASPGGRPSPQSRLKRNRHRQRSERRRRLDCIRAIRRLAGSARLCEADLVCV